MADRRRDRTSRLRAGVVLLFIGIILLVGQLTQQPLWAMLGLGVLCVVAYFATREYGFLVPGGILTGLGVGLLLQVRGGETGNPGLFLVPFGLGFVGIWVFDVLFTRASNWWPLIPGAILIAVGFALWRGGVALDVLEAAGTWWPVILIVIGGWVLIQLWTERGREPAEGEPEDAGDRPEQPQP